MYKTILVFGGSGFIGTHLIRFLSRLEKNRIISVDLLPPRERLKNVDYQIADVRDLSGFSAHRQVDCIYNFAAVHTTPGHLDHEYHETNVGGALEVTRLSSRLGVNEIIFTSSISVYGPSEDVKTEKATLKPNSAYGYSKMLAERVHQNWLESSSERRLIIVRPAVVFGEGEQGNFTRMASLLRKGFFVFPGRRDTVKACIYVDDLIEAIEFARNYSENFVLFNGAYPQRYTLEKIVNTLIDTNFSNAKTFDIPLPIVLTIARCLRMIDAFNIGIHPDRVTKLVRSTNVYPEWLISQGQKYPEALERALNHWCAQSNGLFQ